MTKIVPLLLLFLVLNLTYSKPVDCTPGQVQTTLELVSHQDCTQLYVCRTNCNEFYKGCKKSYTQKVQGESFTKSLAFKMLYFDLNVTASKYSLEAFKRSCVDREFSIITTSFIDKLKSDIEGYLKLYPLEKKSLEKVEKASKIFAWTLKFFFKYSQDDIEEYFNSLYLKTVTRNERSMAILKKIILSFTPEEKSYYELTKDAIINTWVYHIRENGENMLEMNAIYTVIKQDAFRIGNTTKELYFNTPIFDIFDRWVNQIALFKKQCEKENSNNFIKSKALKFDDERMKTSNYPFGKESNFKRGKYENTEDYKYLMKLRSRVYQKILISLKHVRFCECSSLFSYYKKKENELRELGQSTEDLLKEKEYKYKTVKKACLNECKKRLDFFNEHDEDKKINDEAFARYAKRQSEEAQN